MLDQGFTTKNLLKIISKADPKRYKIGRCREEYYEAVNKISSVISADGCSFDNHTISIINKKQVIVYKDFQEVVALRKANDNIKRIFGIKQSDRHEIVSRVICMLGEPVPFYIYKLDIKSFYESVDRVAAIEKIYNSTVVSYQTKKIIKDFFNANALKNKGGLPRGIGLSATLAEFYLSGFDKEIKWLDGVFYFSRYVDDIIIFSHVRIHDFEVFLGEFLPCELSFNRVKCREIYVSDEKSDNKKFEFNYLGYCFSFQGGSVNKGRRNVKVSIAKKKLENIKKRIVLSMKDYIKNEDINLLEKRMRYLTANITLDKSKSVLNDGACLLYSGVYYNYMHINDYNQLIELDCFKNKCLFSKRGSLGAGLLKTSSYQSLNSLKKFSFLSGFKNKRKVKFTYKEILEIRGCW